MSPSEMSTSSCWTALKSYFALNRSFLFLVLPRLAGGGGAVRVLDFGLLVAAYLTSLPAYFGAMRLDPIPRLP